MTERLIISRLAHRGDGVADTPAGPVFVPYTLPGETVEVERVPGHPDRRHLLRVETASPERIAPFCPHFGVCGGCAIQHWASARYRDWKRGLVVEALRAGRPRRAGRRTDRRPRRGRRRATFHARRGARDVLEVGFAALRAHHIVVDRPLPGARAVARRRDPAAWAIAEALAPQKKPLDIQATATDAGIDVDVRGSGPLNPARMTRAGAARRRPIGSRGSPGTANWSRSAPTPTVDDRPRPGGAAARRVPASDRGRRGKPWRGWWQSHVGNAKSVADLFCGVGPFALRLAERARIARIRRRRRRDRGAQAGRQHDAGLKPIEAETRDLFRRPLVAPELKRFDAVVFDPPRQGAEAQARELAKSAVPVVVAVSCNAATFARDARMLVDGGYRLTSVTPVDQFRHSAHVEIVARFER